MSFFLVYPHSKTDSFWAPCSIRKYSNAPPQKIMVWIHTTCNLNEDIFPRACHSDTVCSGCNATVCCGCKLLFIIRCVIWAAEFFSALYFAFLFTSRPPSITQQVFQDPLFAVAKISRPPNFLPSPLR